ncbi:Preprotein translocase subunit YajC [Candidatus Cyrtobacter comes]|uniref:Sec translocon accessory complex subunit YajC n=1 Tax=Candidatus Cyrtobacter comes TaxID=675776 RepID=A0ABU5L6B9_9RICK|nr:preprotein translocase subunit YajC [Candidatus Cyrtobacter comes]MDZ5761667.1 Preprotein translocase subunit YajC [Candidatus Cyrtobacter comes]
MRFRLFLLLFVSTGFANFAFAHDAADLGNLVNSLAPILLIMVVFYFLLIRPQQKRAKAHQEMISLLEKGDEIVLQCGIIGKIAKIEEAFLSLEIAEGTRVRVKRDGIADLFGKKADKIEKKTE